jgi:putative transposase
MARRHHTPEQIIKKLRDAEVMQAAGQSISELVKQLEITEQTFYRWRKQYGGMKTAEVKRLKDLEKENASLKRIVAEQALENRVLKDWAEGNF